MTAEDAALLALKGKPDPARALLTRLGDAAPAVFVRACLDLDAGALGAVRELSERAHLGRGELALLHALTARRAAAPDEDWVASFFAAWREVGPIDVAAGTPARDLGERLDEAAMHAPIQADDPFWKIAGQHRLTVPQVASARALAASSARKLLLITHLPESDGGSAEGIRCELIDELAAAEPDEMAWALMRALDRMPSDRPLSESDVIALEEAVRRPRYGVSFRSLYDAYRSDLAATGGKDPVSDAWWVAITALPDVAGSLWARAKATQDAGTPAVRRRLAAVAERVGREESAQTSFLERMVGQNLLIRAALLREDRAGNEAATRSLEATRALLHEGRRRARYLSGWPIAGLFRDFTRRQAQDEIALYRELAALPVREPALPASPAPDAVGD